MSSIVVSGDTSGAITIAAPAVAGTNTLTLPAVTATLSVNYTPVTASLSANVTMNNTSTYFDGPSVAQGTSGTWFVSGTVTCSDTAGAANFVAKLWDGTTVIASAAFRSEVANGGAVCSLSGYITSPAGNLKISCKDGTSTSGLIIYNYSLNAKDSTITAIRIA
jgi:hypothetical protein